MKKFALLALGLVLLGGCQKRPPHATLPPPPPPIKKLPPSADAILMRQGLELIQRSARMFQQLGSAPQNTVPDAVLNAADCLVIVPNAPTSPNFQRVRGLLTCRQVGQWGPPLFIFLDGSYIGARKRTTDFLLIANERLRQTLRNGSGLQTVRFKQGPLAQEAPIVAETQLPADVLTYLQERGKLLAAAVNMSGLSEDGKSNFAFYRRKFGLAESLSPAMNVPTPVVQFQYAVTSFFNTIRPVGIIVQHSGVLTAKAPEQVDLSLINEFHERLGYEILCFGRIYHVAYHYLILPDGTVQAGRPERCEGAHARGYNSYVGIALVGNFSKLDNPQSDYGPNVPTAAQMKSLIGLCRQLRRRYGIPLQRVVRHSDVASTRCPGDGFPIKTLLVALDRR